MDGNRCFLLTWNPQRWPWPELPMLAQRARSGCRLLDSWGVGRYRQIQPGSRLFLLRLGIEPKGIFASGVALSKPYPDLHWDPRRAALGEKVNKIDLRYEILLNPGLDKILTVAHLVQWVSDTFNWLPQASGICLPVEIALCLEKVWGEWNCAE